jgi:hypothetical protein
MKNRFHSTANQITERNTNMSTPVISPAPIEHDPIGPVCDPDPFSRF